MRHRRVEWAAMEFLLVSQKKNRTWVLLKQLLLLLLRMRPSPPSCCWWPSRVLRNQWGNLLGGTRTHHIVLLDDSFSMSDRWADTDAFAEAKKVVAADRRRGRPAGRSRSRSRCCGSRGPADSQRAAEPDLLKQPVGADFADTLAETAGQDRRSRRPPPARCRRCRPSAQLLGESDGERRVVYLVSDFRARQWDEPGRPAQGAAAARTRPARRSTWSTASTARGRTWRSPRWRRPRASARPACRGSWRWRCRTSAPRRPATCRSSWARTATAGRRSRWPRSRRARSPRSGSRSIFPTPAGTRSPPGWRATPWRPTTTATARSICRRTCRCCWSTATPRPATPAI